jgi:hypothetical protein
MQNGKYIAKITSYGLQEAKSADKADSIVVRFETKPDAAGEVYSLTWFGSLSEKAFERTLASLLGPLGMIASPDQVEGYLEAIATDGLASGMLNTEKEVELVVENEEYNGKTHARIKWINEPGTSNEFKKLATDQVKGRFKHLNIAGAAAAIQSKTPKVTGALATPPPPTTPPANPLGLPF